MLKKYSLIILVFCALICAACFSPWKGDEGIVSIRIDGGNAGSRQAAWLDKDIIPFLKHTITLEGPGPKQTRSDIKYGGSAKFSVAPGLWEISVIAEEVKDGNKKLIAAGYKSVVIKPGQNGNIIIPIQPVSDVKITLEDIKSNEPKIINMPITSDSTRIKISLDKEYDSIEWNCKGITGSGKYFILDYIDNSSYDEEKKIYYLYITVEVWADGIPCSNKIIIEIPEGEKK